MKRILTVILVVFFALLASPALATSGHAHAGDRDHTVFSNSGSHDHCPLMKKHDVGIPCPHDGDGRAQGSSIATECGGAPFGANPAIGPGMAHPFDQPRAIHWDPRFTGSSIAFYVPAYSGLLPSALEPPPKLS